MSNTMYGILFNEGYFDHNNYIITIQRKGKSDVATDYSFNSFSKPLVRKSLASIEKAIEDIVRSKNNGNSSRYLFKVAEFSIDNDGSLTFVKSFEPTQQPCYRIKAIGTVRKYVYTYGVESDKEIRDVCLTERIEQAMSWTNRNTVTKLVKQMKKAHPELNLVVSEFMWGFEN